MYTFQELTIGIYICCICGMLTEVKSKSDGSADAQTGSVTINVVGLEIQRENLQCRYRVENNSKHDIWLCDAMQAGCADLETVWGEDKQTYVIRKRTDITWDFAREQPTTRYIRLRAGRNVTDTLVLPLPLRAEGVLSDEGVPPDTEYVRRIALEIGYYEGDLPTMIRDTLEKDAANHGKNGEAPPRVPPVLHFNELNECLRDSAEEIFFYINPIHPTVKGERVLRAYVDDQRIPQKGTSSHRPSAPNLRSCNRLEITYEPSALEYFFPYEDQQCVFDSTEVQYLRSLRTVFVDDSRSVKEFAYQVGKARRQGISVRNNRAHVICCQNSDRLVELDVYAHSLISGACEPYSCPEAYLAGYFERFRGLASQVRPFDLRVACARNLRDLYNRLRLYPKAEGWRLMDSGGDTKVQYTTRSELEYPAPPEWCDSIISAYRSIGMLDEPVNKPFRCRSGDEGKCHYAMNTACKPDSPPGMVLLFETKAGWNQHGGPELFTFDNHDPKGGLVLLNDGTVKFIRTEEELKQLRWK